MIVYANDGTADCWQKRNWIQLFTLCCNNFNKHNLISRTFVKVVESSFGSVVYICRLFVVVVERRELLP